MSTYEIIYTAHDEDGEPAADGWTDEDGDEMPLHDTARDWIALLCEYDAAECGIYRAGYTRYVTLSITVRRETEHELEEHTEEVTRAVPAGAGLEYVPEPPEAWRLVQMRDHYWAVAHTRRAGEIGGGPTPELAVRSAYRLYRWAGYEKALIALVKRGAQ